MLKEEPEGLSQEKRKKGGLRTTGDRINESKEGLPLVTIVTVCLNSEATLEETIKSVVDQTYKNIEYIIIDGGSRDGTLDIIRTYEGSISYWLSEPDNGIYDAMNKGLALARGDLVGIINSDDFYETNAVEQVVKASLEYVDAEVFFGDLYLISSREKDVFERQKGSLAGLSDCTLECKFNHPTCFLRNDLYGKHAFRTDLKVIADYELMFRLQREGARFHYIDQPLAYFRLSGISSNLYAMHAEHYSLRKECSFINGFQYSMLRFFLPVTVFFLDQKERVFKTVFKGNRGHKAVTVYKKARVALGGCHKKISGRRRPVGN